MTAEGASRDPASDVEGRSERAAVLPRWSRVAVSCVGALVVTGAYQAWREVRVLAALAGTGYGRLLLGKLAAVGAVLAVAVIARRALRARESSGSAGGLRTIVTAEAVIGLAVLGVTSFLVATPPSRVTFGPPWSTSAVARDVEGNTLPVGVDVTSTRTGPATLRLRVQGGDGYPLPFVAASGRLRPEAGSERVDVTFAPDGEGRASAPVVVPTAGRWTLTVNVQTDATTAYAATVAYVVR